MLKRIKNKKILISSIILVIICISSAFGATLWSKSLTHTIYIEGINAIAVDIPVWTAPTISDTVTQVTYDKYVNKVGATALTINNKSPNLGKYGVIISTLEDEVGGADMYLTVSVAGTPNLVTTFTGTYVTYYIEGVTPIVKANGIPFSGTTNTPILVTKVEMDYQLGLGGGETDRNALMLIFNFDTSACTVYGTQPLTITVNLGN